MAVQEINLPTLSSDQTDHRSQIENHVLAILEDFVDSNIIVRKYFKSANEEIYRDCLNLTQSGVPGYFIRTRREETDEANPAEMMDAKTTRLEIICASPVGIEKGIKNVDRYVYVMNVIARDLLRMKENRIKFPNNRRRPFIYLGNRDIFRNDEIDILLTEFNIEYVVI